MAFEVNNNGINRIDGTNQKKKYQKPEAQEIQCENRDYTEAFSALGASAMAQFQACKKFKQPVREQEEFSLAKKFKSADEFIASLSKEPTMSDTAVDSILSQWGFTLEEIENLRSKLPLTTIVEALNICVECEGGEITKKEITESFEQFKANEDLRKTAKFLNEKMLNI